MNYSDGSSIPMRKTQFPTRAKRVAAHSETQNNDLKSTTQKASTPRMPKTGFRGNGGA